MPELIVTCSWKSVTSAIRRCGVLCAVVGAWFTSARVAAQTAPEVNYSRQIQPLLARRCYSCHGPDKAEGGLRLDRRESAFGPLESGEKAIVAKQPDASELLKRLTTDDESLRMPAESPPLPAEQIELVRRWIAGGAAWEEHWAFQPVKAVEPPAVRHPQWVANPIDAFVAAGLEQAGLEPRPAAEKTAWLRRVTFDLTGLPPTPAEAAAYLADASPRADEKVVDRLLQSPRYGERWARHWLDIVRYADTNSFERDGVKPNIWRYRDYVIDAFNNDKPYDQFIREQLAGDELPGATAETLTATGFYRLGLWDDEPADRLLAKYDVLDDMVSTTGQVFLGLTINCARCHDHKIDPLSMHDYYGMLAFFHGVTTAPNSFAPLNDDAPDVAGAGAGAEAPKPMRPKRRGGAEGNQILCVKEDGPQPPPTFILRRGNPQVKGEQVEPRFPAILTSAKPTFPPRSAGAATSGRRTVLAQWLASAENPLTARVIVNRVWQHHFGRGIVRSPNNFGLLGDRPTHRELLDWLAARFVRDGWRLKPLHRLIVLSATYRRASSPDAAALTKDPLNDHFWRFDPRRLGAEEVRDAILAVNGRLNLQMYGPGVFPEISAEVLAGQSKPGDGWGKSSPEEQARRAIYIHVKRSLVTPILADFDFADTDTSCPVRFATTQPTQALGMLNGKFVNDQAAALAARLKREAGGDVAAQVKLALRVALSREPTAGDEKHGLDLIAKLRERHGLSADKALDQFCLYVLNLNEFVYLD